MKNSQKTAQSQYLDKKSLFERESQELQRRYDNFILQKEKTNGEIHNNRTKIQEYESEIKSLDILISQNKVETEKKK